MNLLKMSVVTISVMLSALLPTLGHTHVLEPNTATFTQGFIHPLFSLNHLLTITIMALISVQLPSRKLWLVPICFIYLVDVHGHIHYHEIFMYLSAFFYALGLLTSTALLYGLTVMLGLGMKRYMPPSRACMN